MDLKQELEKILQGVNPKQFTRRLSSFPKIFLELNRQTDQYSPKNISQRVHIILNGLPPLTACGKIPQFNTFTLGYREFCGSKCQCAKESHSNYMSNLHKNMSDEEKLRRKQKAETTYFEKTGYNSPFDNPEVINQIENTCLQNYGVKKPFQNQSIREKTRHSCMENHGVLYPFQSQEILNKTLETTRKRYGGLMTHARQSAYEKFGGVNPFSDTEIKEKIKSILYERYNRNHPKQFHLTDEQLLILKDPDKFAALIDGKTFTESAKELGVDGTTISRYCDHYDLRHLKAYSTSINERIIVEILDDLNVNYIRNTKEIISPFELDFFLPDYNVAFEVGSVWYHSEINGNRGRFYHWNKWSACNALGIDLYQWFDYELNNSFELIKSKIKYILNQGTKNNIGARKTIISNSVPIKDEREFLNTNHIQGFSKDRSYTFGAYYNNKLVGIMTFAVRPKYIELTRFSTDISNNYPGLFSKMLKHAMTLIPNGDIVSFSDNNHSNGNLYKVNGFVIDGYVKPGYKYTKNYYDIISRRAASKKMLKRKYPDLDYSKSEWELMNELGYDRFWDSGKIRWIISRS